jgi:hypothetical protein
MARSGSFSEAAFALCRRWLAARAFLKYRRSGGVKTSPLPDFYIGARAETENRTLITRDAVRYRACFPNVVLITPS